MKKYLFSLFICLSLFLSGQQMNFSIAGDIVTFSANTGSDWGSTPMYVYAYVEASDTTPAGTVSTDILGAWPGTQLTGSGPYTAIANLSSFFSPGTVVNNIKFIYNNGGVGGTTYQNPPIGQPGFNATDTSKASGWSAVTVAGLAGVESSKLQSKSKIANGILHTPIKGNLDIQVYDFNGKLLKKLHSNNSSKIDLNLEEKGVFILTVTNGKELEMVKFSN